MSVPKLHHYLPEGYLRGFLDSTGVLWVFDRRTGEVRRQRPETSGAEREMYTLDSDTEPNREAETLLAAHVDGPGLGVIQSLHDGTRLTAEGRHHLAMFAASLYLRTPSVREQHRATNEQMRAALLEMGVDPGTASDPDPPDLSTDRGAVRADVLLASIDASRSADRPYQNDFVTLMMGLVPQIGETLLSLQWLIVLAPPRKSFVTCDTPVVITRPEGHHPVRGVGIVTPGAEKIVPLSPHAALVMWDRTARNDVRVGIMDPDRLRSVNEMFMRQCERFVFSRSEQLLRSLARAVRPERIAPSRVELVGRG
jgi:hypothetical protein